MMPTPAQPSTTPAMIMSSAGYVEPPAKQLVVVVMVASTNWPAISKMLNSALPINVGSIVIMVMTVSPKHLPATSTICSTTRCG